MTMTVKLLSRAPILLATATVAFVLFVSACSVFDDPGFIVYSEGEVGERDIVIVDPNGQNRSVVVGDESDDFAPVWSPDQSRIAFLSDREGVMNLWVAKSDGSAPPEQLSDQEIHIPSKVWAVSLSIRWTPDGDSIGYVMPAVDGPSLWMIDRLGGEPGQPVRSGVLRFDWYLDRNRIVYTTATENGAVVSARMDAGAAPVFSRVMSSVATRPKRTCSNATRCGALTRASGTATGTQPATEKRTRGMSADCMDGQSNLDHPRSITLIMYIM